MPKNDALPEHEIHHVALDLAGWSARHTAVLASTAKRFGLDLPAYSFSATTRIDAAVGSAAW